MKDPTAWSVRSAELPEVCGSMANGPSLHLCDGLNGDLCIVFALSHYSKSPMELRICAVMMVKFWL